MMPSVHSLYYIGKARRWKREDRLTERKQVSDPVMREIARRIRDWQWEFADKAALYGAVWLCVWDKERRHEPKEKREPNLVVTGLIDGMELLQWLDAHRDWWEIGEFSDKRYALPVSLTALGREAIAQRELYDMEPVRGGLVEPGWEAVPLERNA